MRKKEKKRFFFLCFGHILIHGRKRRCSTTGLRLAVLDDGIVNRAEARDSKAEKENRSDDDVAKEEEPDDDREDGLHLTGHTCGQGGVDGRAEEDKVVQKEGQDGRHQEAQNEPGVGPVLVVDQVFGLKEDHEDSHKREGRLL